MSNNSRNIIASLIREMYDDVKPGYSRMGTFDRPGPTVGSEKTILPELPILAQPQAAAQLSVSLPDVDDADAVPVGPDLASFMAALAGRVPDEEAAKFYRLVRKHVEKHYGREHDDKIGRVEETKSMNDKQVKRIVEAVKRILLENENSEPSAPYFGAPGGNYFELKKYLEDDNDTFEENEVEVILDYVKGKYRNLEKYGFDIDEDWNDLVVYSVDSGKPVETINYTDIEKEVTSRDELAPAPAAARGAAEPEAEAEAAAELLGADEPGVIVRLEARADAEGARIVYDAADELGDKEKNPGAYHAQQKQYIKLVRQNKVSVLNSLGLSSTLQRAGRDGKGSEIKEVPYYPMEFALVAPGFRASSGYQNPDGSTYWRITIRTGYAPGNYIVVAVNESEFQWGGGDYKVLGGKVEGKTVGAISGKELDEFIRLFKLENVKGSGFKMSKAKADEYQRMTGEKASETAKSSYQSLAPELAAMYPGKYKSDKDMTGAVKGFIDRSLFQQFIAAAKSYSLHGSPANKATQSETIEKIMNVFDKNYVALYRGNAIDDVIKGRSEGAERLRLLFAIHYALRDPLHITSNSEKLYKDFTSYWKAEFNREYSAQLNGPNKAKVKLIWDNRLERRLGEIMSALLVSEIGDSSVLVKKFDAVDSPERVWQSAPNKFESDAAVLGIGPREYYDTALDLCERALEGFFAESKLPDVSDADVTDWINDMLNLKDNQDKMVEFEISIDLKATSPKSKKGKANESVYFDKFMDRIISESEKKKRLMSEPGADMNARMRLRAAREMEHYLHSTRFKR